MSRIAFLGLGAMGSRMAARLIASGHELTLWNRTARPAESFAATFAETPADAVRGVDMAISMLTDDEASKQVWEGKEGALGAMDASALAVEASTVSPARIATLSRLASEAGIDFIDAPVAGSRPQAEAGELVFLAGGAEETVERFRRVAGPMGKTVLHAGATGQGITAKMMVNALLAAQTAIMAELLHYGSSHGMSPEDALSLLSQLPVTSPAAAAVGKLMAAGTHEPQFTIDLLVKDLGYFLDGQDAPVITATREVFSQAQHHGKGQRHISAVFG